MHMRLVGLQPVNFTTDDGKHINGTNCYVLYESQNVEGLKADRIFINTNIELPSGIKPNDLLDVRYGMRNKIESISIAKS